MAAWIQIPVLEKEILKLFQCLDSVNLLNGLFSLMVRSDVPADLITELSKTNNQCNVLFL